MNKKLIIVAAVLLVCCAIGVVNFLGAEQELSNIEPKRMIQNPSIHIK